MHYQLGYLCNIALDFQMFLNNCHYILSNNALYYTISISLALSISVFFSSLLQLINGTQFLNITSLFLSYACRAAVSAPAPVVVILPLTSIYASP